MKKMNENREIGNSKSDESKSNQLIDFKWNMEMGSFLEKPVKQTPRN